MTDKYQLVTTKEIENRIYNIRGVPVMIDNELAELYGVETRVLNQAVSRNIDRFPLSFRFQLSKEEIVNLISQNVISSTEHGGRRKLPYVFTEQGVAMLSAVLHSQTAVKISIQIMQAFVSDLIRSGKSSLVLIDNYVDDSVLTLLTKRKKGVKASIYTGKISKQLALDLKKHNAQYPSVEVKALKNVHDRFLLIDHKELYHFGASLKDLGKKWFAFSKLEFGAIEMINKLNNL